MLREAKDGWSVTCSACPAEAPLAVTTLDAARTAATALGWMDQARRGAGVAKWKWLCPACRPKPGTGFGASTM